MKYKKPQDAMHMLDLVVEGGGVLNWVRDVKAFLHSLPDRPFEIVEPGMTQVRWPDGVTRSELDGWCDDLTRYVPENADILRYLRQLAAIAPVEKARQYVLCYRRECGPFANVVAKEYPLGMEADKWKVVGGPYDIGICEAVEPPVEKKKRKIAIWQWRSGGELRIFDHDINPNGINSEDKNWWIKKGEGEVSE